MDAGFTDLTTIEEKKQRYVKKPDAATAKALANFSFTQGEIKTAVAYFNDATKYDPDSDYISELFDLYVSGYERKIYTMDELITIADKALVSEKTDPPLKLSVYAQMSYYIKDDPDSKKLLDYTKNGYDYLNKNLNKASNWSKNTLNLNYALFIEKNVEKAIEIRKKSMKEGWENNAGQLNSFAWWCFENKINLEEAAELGRRGVKLAPAGHEKAMILDTVAEIENLRGNLKESVNLMEEAMKEDPDSESWKKQLDRFKKELNKS